jgi:hypothetical protein
LSHFGATYFDYLDEGPWPGGAQQRQCARADEGRQRRSQSNAPRLNRGGVFEARSHPLLSALAP